MLPKFANRCLTHFAADFKNTFGVGIPEAAKKLADEYEPKRVGFNDNSNPGHTLMWPEECRTLVVGVTRVAYQTLGWVAWTEHQDMVKRAISLVCHKPEVNEFTRVGFKLQAYFPQEMTVEELCDLFFTASFTTNPELARIIQPPHDAGLLIVGQRGEFQARMESTPLNGDGTSESFLAQKHIRNFASKLYADDRIAEFNARIKASPSLLVDIDIWKHNVPIAQADSIIRQLTTEAASAVEAFESFVLFKSQTQR